jgi:hypothetical protein
VVLIWNERDVTLPWARDLGALMHQVGASPSTQGALAAPLFEGDPHVRPFSRWVGSHKVAMSRADLLDMVASRSYVNVLAPEAREDLIDQAAQIVHTLPEPIMTPYVTFAYCAEVIAEPCGCKGESWSG